MCISEAGKWEEREEEAHSHRQVLQCDTISDLVMRECCRPPPFVKDNPETSNFICILKNLTSKHCSTHTKIELKQHSSNNVNDLPKTF